MCSAFSGAKWRQGLWGRRAESLRLHGAGTQQGDTSPQRLDCQWRQHGRIGFSTLSWPSSLRLLGSCWKGMRGLLPWKLRGKSKYVGSCVRICFHFLQMIFIFILWVGIKVCREFSWNHGVGCAWGGWSGSCGFVLVWQYPTMKLN